eukprot:TRINITY_DN11933_c0_g1_i1.p1 TRINITY_DN11933_c0_g1~~TRINITY_DN11933_c0_g1_i1.p1  ORF type:complete len:342 (-),score=72.49 TRINITY_DN11933_c0_g1_i1:35-1060(-)
MKQTIVILVLIAFLGIIRANECETMSFKLLTYNIGTGASSTYFELIDYIKDESPDIVALQELNNWSSNKLRETGQSWGHEYTHFLHANTGYHLGITSKYEFDLIESRTQGFHHGLIEIKIKVPMEELNANLIKKRMIYEDDVDLDETIQPIYEDLIDVDDYTINFYVLVSHLTPDATKDRLNEAHHLDHQSRLHPNTILMGDLNALSVYDKYHYDQNNTLLQLQEEALSNYKIREKFLYVNEDGYEALDYRVLDLLYNGGFFTDSKDIYYNQVLHKNNDYFTHSVPTSSNNDIMHAAPLRLDYILLTQSLSEFLIDYKIDHSYYPELVSDHYPVTISLCFE